MQQTKAYFYQYGEFFGLDETRRELALQYLGNSRLSINEVTYLLGFSDPSNFTRAFKRWQGIPPSQYRESRTG